MTEHPRDDLAAFALDALDDRERRSVATHLETCASCRAEVEAYRSALSAYAAAADRPAPDLRSRIVARARGNGWTAWLRRPIPAFVPALLAVLLVASVVSFGLARRDADSYAAALAAIASARVVGLEPAAGSDVRGSLVIPESGAPYLLLRVPQPPSGKAWEAWVLRASGPVPAGLNAQGGVITITLTAPLAPGEGVAVTSEPAAGSSAPTSTPVLVAPRI